MNQAMLRVALPEISDAKFTLAVPGGSASRGRIVIADDDLATRLVLAKILTRSGFTVYPYDNGRSACEAVKRKHPDVVLLDWIMPIVDGLRASEILKSDVETRSIPIVILTTHSEIEDRHMALAVGVQDFVTKPFDPRQLVICIEQQMRWRTIISGACAIGGRHPASESFKG